MIDPGHPFSVLYEDLIEAMEERIRYGVEQPDRARRTFRGGVTSYELPRPAYAVSRVTGLMNNAFTVFQPGVHYGFSNNRVRWIHATEQPDEGSRFEIEYTYRERPAGLTDFNPGSVTGTVIRAVSREAKLLYEQMDQAYRRAFIDIASGVALDNVVALLGVNRNPALEASGDVTFLRNNPTDQDITIPQGTRVSDESERLYATTEDAILVAEAVEFRTASGDSVTVTNKVAELVGIWQREDDAGSVPPLADPNTPGLQFSEDERTITLSSGLLPAGDLRIRYKPKSCTVPIKALEAGPDGNVNSEAIIIMPTPPSGIDGVINELPVEGGQVAETDDLLRERAKHALEQSGNATLNAIKYAVLGITGVEGVEVVDNSVDDTIPLGEVRVRVSGGDPEEVQNVVNETRAAGIIARLEIIETLLVSGIFYAIPDTGVPETASGEFVAAVIDSIDELAIGQSMSLRRLNALAYQVGGLADVAEAQLVCKGSPVTEPLLIESTELIRPDESNLHVVMLDCLRGQREAATKLNLELWLEDSNGNTVSFDNFSLDITVTLRALSTTALDQPPERVGRFTTTLNFVGGSVATLTIDPATHAPQFRPGDHNTDVQVSINAAAYPGLKPVDGLIADFTP